MSSFLKNKPTEISSVCSQNCRQASQLNIRVRLNYLYCYEDDEAEEDDEAVAAACGWESMRSMSSSSLTPQVSTTQIRQLVTGNARTLLQVTHLSEEENQNILIQRLNKLLLNCIDLQPALPRWLNWTMFCEEMQLKWFDSMFMSIFLLVWLLANTLLHLLAIYTQLQ